MTAFNKKFGLGFLLGLAIFESLAGIGVDVVIVIFLDTSALLAITMNSVTIATLFAILALWEIGQTINNSIADDDKNIKGLLKFPKN